MELIKKYLDKALESTIILLMAANVINVLWQIFTRFVLKDPSSFTEELARYLLIWVGLLGAGYAVSKKLHLAIDIIPGRLEGKNRLILDIAVESVIFLFAFLVLVIGGIRLVGITLMLNQVSAALQIKMGYVYLALPLSGLIIMFYSLEKILEKFRSQPGGEKE